jgi:hypothetical protein
MTQASVRVAMLGFLALAGVSCGRGDATSLLTPDVVTPTCATPAPLFGKPNAQAPGFIVVLQDSVDAIAESQRLATRYDFTPSHVYTAALRGFSAVLSAGVVADLRCEVNVRYVEYDAVVTPT